jgi:hypothetical protein
VEFWWGLGKSPPLACTGILHSLVEYVIDTFTPFQSLRFFSAMISNIRQEYLPVTQGEAWLWRLLTVDVAQLGAHRGGCGAEYAT